jgi:hypothetical protein
MMMHLQSHRQPAQGTRARTRAALLGKGSGNRQSLIRPVKVVRQEHLGHRAGVRTLSSIRIRRKTRTRQQPKIKRKENSTPCWRRNGKASLTTKVVDGNDLAEDLYQLSLYQYPRYWVAIQRAKFGITTLLKLSSRVDLDNSQIDIRGQTLRLSHPMPVYLT